MKRVLLFLFSLFISGTVLSQVSGTYSIPSADFPTIKSAFNALNTGGVGGSGVIFNVAAGHTELTADSMVLSASGRASGMIVFQKSGTGNDPIVYRTGTGTMATSVLGGNGDAVIILQGCDYVRFDGIAVSDTNKGIEYGYYLTKANATNGCSNVTITNCKVTMTKGNSAYVIGIYASNHASTSAVNDAAGIFITDSTGRHENITITGNTISNVATGIMLRGYAHTTSPYAFYDKNFTIGAPGLGNTIQNFAGGTASTSYGIYALYHKNLNIKYNTINNKAGGGTDATSTIYGMYLISTLNGGDVVITGNNIILNQGATSAAHCIYLGHLCTSITISDNNFSYGNFASTTSSYLIYCSSATNIVTVTNNKNVGAINKPGTAGYIYGYYNLGSPTGGTETIANNTFSDITMAGSGYFYGIYSGTSAAQNKEIYGNTIRRIVTGSGTTYGINSTYGNISNIYSNTIDSVYGGSTVYGIVSGGTSSVTHNTYNNLIKRLSSTGASSVVYGIQAVTATNNNIYRNKIYDLTTMTSGGSVNGIYVSSGTNIYVSNNYISDLKAPLANAATPVNGIYFAGGTNSGGYYNTIYLNATSSGALFGSSGIYASGTVNVDLRNNIVINKSGRAGATGFTVAFRRSAAYNATYYSSLSNANDFYSLSPTGLFDFIFYDGTNKDSTIADYKTRVSPRDANSVSVMPPFVNSVTAPYDLHLLTTESTGLESGGVQVTTPVSIGIDFDNEARYPNAGYPNNPEYPATAPDIGADEFAGIPSFTCEQPVPGNTLTTANNLCYGATITLSMQNPIPGTGVTYQWQSSPDSLIFTNIQNATGLSYTFMPDKPYWFRCIVLCQNGSLTGYSTPLRIRFVREITNTTPASRCGTGSVTLQATASSGTINWYAASTGGTVIGTGTSFTTPTITQTTPFYAVADQISPMDTVGKIAPAGTTNTTLSNYGMVFNALTDLTIQSVDVYPATNAGQMNIAIYQNSVLKVGPVNYTFPAGSGTTPHTVTLNFSVPMGTGYRLMITSMSGGNLVRESSGSTYPYTGDYLSITSGATSLTGTSTSAYYWFYNWKVFSACNSPRVEVLASVVDPPALTVTASQTVCNNVPVMLEVTSSLTDFDSYIWSPVTSLFTDVSCTIPYTGSSATTVYCKTATPGSNTYSCSALNNSTACSNVAQTTVSVLPASPVISSNPGSICVSGSAVLSVTPSSGYGAATFQWQESVDNITFYDISGATNLNYTTPLLGLTTYYQLIIRNGSGTICTQVPYTMVVDNPAIITSTGAMRCGPGTTQLYATSNQGILQWYDNPMGGTVLGTGSPFTTPFITTTTNYYVSAVMPGSIIEPAGKPAPTLRNSLSTANYGEVFTADQDVVIQTVDVYPSGATNGEMFVALYGSSSNLLAGPTYFAFPAGDSVTPYTLTLNYRVPAGTGYRLLATAIGSGKLIREGSGVTYPIHSDSLITLTSAASSLTATSTTTYNYFYNWKVQYGCASPMVAVEAYMNLPPFLTVSDTSTVCPGEAATLMVTSTVSDFDVYTWSPVTNLYLDAAGTVPYTEGTNATKVFAKASEGGLYTYTCFALDTVINCTNYADAVVIVIPDSTYITADPGSICVSGSAVLTLHPSTGYGDATFLWQSSANNVDFFDIPGSTTTVFTTPVISSTMYYRLNIFSGSTLLCSQPSYALNVTSPSIVSTTPGVRCGQGTVDLAAISSPNTTIRWYNAATGGTQLGTGPTFTTPVIANTTSFYVAASADDAAVEKPVASPNVGTSNYINSSVGWGLRFTVNSLVKIKTVKIYPSATTAGPANIQIKVTDLSDVVLYSGPVYNFNALTTVTEQTVPVDVNVPPGNYKMVMTWGGNSSLTLRRELSGAGYPYNSPGNEVSITAGANGSGTAQTTGAYYWFYHWLIESFCESPRTEVVATVTPAASINTNATPDSICRGASAQLSATSSNSGYQYTWTPGDLSGAMQTVSPNVSTIYTVTGVDTATGCNNSETVLVTIKTTPPPLSIIPPAPVINPGDVQLLTVLGGSVPPTAVFGTGTTVNTTTGVPAPYSMYYGGNKYQMLIRKSELLAAGLVQGAYITSLTFNVTAVGTAFPGTLAAFQVDLGHTSDTVMNANNFINGVTNVLAPDSVAIQIGLNTHTFDVPFVWNGVDNLVVQTSFSNNISGTSSMFVQMTYTPTTFVSTAYYRDDAATPEYVLAYNDPAGAIVNRPNMILGLEGSANLEWTPVTGLYLDAAATVAYAGESTDSVYSKPAETITYTVIGSDTTTGCNSSQTVTVTVLPPCDMPAGVMASNVEVHTATISWTAPEPGPGSGYMYQIRTSGLPGEPTGLVTEGSTMNTYVDLTGLDAYTQYYAYVRSNCGDNVYSGWTTGTMFTTLQNPLGVTGLVIDESCNWNCDGSITTSVTGGFTPYTYLWNTSETTPDLSGLCAGDYTVTVTDATLASVVATWTVNSPGEVSVWADVENLSCYESNDGSITLTMVSGGTPPYTYLWSTGATTQNISNLAAGYYTCEVYDSHGCMAYFGQYVSQPMQLQASVFADDATCPGASDGSATAYANGGLYPYTYLWSTGATTSEITGLSAGTYTVTINDAGNCGPVVKTAVIQNAGMVCDNIVVIGNYDYDTCFDAMNTIITAGGGYNFIVEATGSVELFAGIRIDMLPGSKVMPGGYLHAKIVGAGPFCNPLKLTEVIAGKDEPLPVTDRPGFTLYPNPTTGNFMLVQKSDPAFADVRVEIFSMQGEKILTERLIGEKSHEFRFADMASGLYFVKIVANDYTETIKLVKTK